MLYVYLISPSFSSLFTKGRVFFKRFVNIKNYYSVKFSISLLKSLKSRLSKINP